MVAFTSQADWFKLAMVVVPVGWMVNILTPVEEATKKGLIAPVPWIVTVFCGVVVPTLRILEMVAVPVIAKVEEALNHKKLAEEAVLDAAVA